MDQGFKNFQKFHTLHNRLFKMQYQYYSGKIGEEEGYETGDEKKMPPGGSIKADLKSCRIGSAINRLLDTIFIR